MPKTKTQRLVFTALLTALTCVTTMAVKIPSPLNGYLNLGDAAVLLAAFLLPPAYGCFAAGVGSALADLFSGYAMYAPATLLIKGLMAITVRLLSLLFKKKGKRFGYLLGSVLAELLMIAGYFVFEGFLYGFAPSAVNIPANAVQGVAGIVLGVLLSKVFEKANITLD